MGCTVVGCDRPHCALGLCSGHLTRLRKHGDTLADQPLSRHKNATRLAPGGYVYVWAPNHSAANSTGYAMQHRHVMAQHLGRALHRDETVHHINGRRDDNRLENLELWVSNHPAGQRPEDIVAWSVEMLERYAPERLSGDRDTATPHP